MKTLRVVAAARDQLQFASGCAGKQVDWHQRGSFLEEWENSSELLNKKASAAALRVQTEVHAANGFHDEDNVQLIDPEQT